MAAVEPSRSRWRRATARLMPAVVPLAMRWVFRTSAQRYGPRRGYQVGFVVYWVSCWALTTAVLGRRAPAGLWQRPEPVLPSPPVLAAAALVTPPLGGVAAEWLPARRGADLTTLAVTALVGTTNAVSEEVLWRGVPTAVFPDESWWGWLWPALGFAAWHLVPLTQRPVTAERRAAVLAGAAAIGLGYGWIALRSQSLALVAAAHAITDSSASVRSEPPGSTRRHRPELRSRDVKPPHDQAMAASHGAP